MLRAMWRNWAIGMGAMVLPIVLGMFMSLTWLPFVALAEIYVLATIYRRRTSEGIGASSLLIKIAEYTIIASALIMVAINIACTDWFLPTIITFKLYNREIPYIASLIIFPVNVFFCCWALYMGNAERHFRRCQRRSGDFAGESIVASLFLRETRYQVGTMLILSFLLAGIEYWYYFFRYINANLNDPDRFFFAYMPAVLYLVSLVMMRGRYIGMESMYSNLEDVSDTHRNTVKVRFLVFCEDELLLAPNQYDRWDTPFSHTVKSRRAPGPAEVRKIFGDISGLKDFAMRYCFTTEGLVEGTSTVHYAIFIPDDTQGKAEAKAPGAKWFTSYLLDHAMATGALATSTAAELYRIYTITMAWKTYDSHGRRLYPIRGYRPTFRLGDLQNWDVDYDDTSWLHVSHYNEDRHLFRLRSLWARITGILSGQ